jgi:Tol biopolymer transport system component
VAYTSALVTINVEKLGFDPVKGEFIGEPSLVTTGTRRWSSPDPSPDGEWVAFYSLAQPEGHLYVSRSNGTGLRRLTGDSAVADRVPRWSPDGRWIAYFSNRAGNFHLWKIRADGSGLQRLTPRIAAYGAWSPDGQRIATSGGANLGDSVRLYTVDADEPFEAQRPDIAPPSALGRFYTNSWSPDGTKLVGQLGQIGTGGTGIAVYSIGDKNYERITDFGEWPVWLPDGRRFLFVADGNTFYVADSRTKEVRKVYWVTRDVIGPPRLTRDGRMAFFSRRVTDADIWLRSMDP